MVTTAGLDGDFVGCRHGTILRGVDEKGELCAGRIAWGRASARKADWPADGSCTGDLATGGRCVLVLRMRMGEASGSSSPVIHPCCCAPCQGSAPRWGEVGALPITTRLLSSSEESPNFGETFERLFFLCTRLLPSLSFKVGSEMRRFGARPSLRLSKLKMLKPVSCGELPAEETACGDVSGMRSRA
jgi:hypothetical protein